jgi:hypothetical protein
VAYLLKWELGLELGRVRVRFRFRGRVGFRFRGRGRGRISIIDRIRIGLELGGMDSRGNRKLEL